MDKITEILKEMHEMADEPVRMQEGGTVLSPEDYQSQYVDFYAPFTIDVQQAPEPEDEDEVQEPVRPDILTPVGERGAPNVFGQIPIYGSGQKFGTEDYNSYIENFDNQQAADLSGKSFSRYLEQAGGAVTLAVQPAFGATPIGAIAYGMGQLARKQHRKNAGAIQAVGGSSGDMFKFNGQTVSRAPGSKFFTGNLGGLSQADMYRNREIEKFGFIPGTMKEIPGVGRRGQDTRRSISGLSGVTRIEGAIMDAFGTVHAGQRDESGHMMVSAGQAQRLREQEFRDMARQKGIDISGLEGANFVNAAVDYKQMLDAHMKGQSYHGGFFHKTSRMTDAQNRQALKDRNDFGVTAFDKILDKYNITTTPTTTSDSGTSPAPDKSGGIMTEAEPTVGGDDGGGSDNGGGSSAGTSYSLSNIGSDQGNVSAPLDFDSFSSTGFEGYDDEFYSRGGRVGMQAGGVAAQPAGFVEGPPENFTEKQTVADDRPMSVPEGTFVINAAAVEFAGSDDIKEMLSKAYAKLRKKVDKSIRVAKIPTEDEIDVAVSRGEVIVPPEIAKIIGYDRLEKINNRGKKEVTRRQKKAGGGFLAGKKLAEGGEAKDNPALNYEDKIIRDEVARKIGILLENFERQSDGEKVYTENFDPQYEDDRISIEFFDMLARLNNMTQLKGGYSAYHDDVNAPTTPTLFNLFVLAEELAHSDYYRNEGLQRENPHSRLLKNEKGELIPKMNPDYDIFEAESDYLEELRAKTIAFETVGQMLPKSQKFAEMTLDRYKEIFLHHLKREGASPEVIAAMTEKYGLDDTMYVQYPLGQYSPSDFEVTKEQMHRSAVGDEKDLMLYDETPRRYASGGKTPEVLPEPSPVRQKKIAARQEAERMADVELRADLEEFIRDDQLARLGWDLYTSGELMVAGFPTPFDYTRVIKGEGEDARETVRDEESYLIGGTHTPIPGRETRPYYEGSDKIIKSRTSINQREDIAERLDKMGVKPSDKIPLISYFAEPQYIPPYGRTDPEKYMGDRATVMITLAHELRHAALNYLHFEHGAPRLSLGREERLMDYFDDKARNQASEKNALVSAESPYEVMQSRGEVARYTRRNIEQAELFNELAAEILKKRGVPPVAKPEEKGFITRTIDKLFSRPHPATGTLKKGGGKPVDYESEAMQSAQF